MASISTGDEDEIERESGIVKLKKCIHQSYIVAKIPDVPNAFLKITREWSL